MLAEDRASAVLNRQNPFNFVEQALISPEISDSSRVRKHRSRKDFLRLHRLSAVLPMWSATNLRIAPLDRPKPGL